MHYTVTTSPTAEEELAFIWIIASDRDAVSRASNEIDKLLRRSPLSCGINHGSFRTLTVDPLLVAFTVSPDDRQVKILQFTYHGR
jgi:hypothetical protein